MVFGTYFITGLILHAGLFPSMIVDVLKLILPSVPCSGVKEATEAFKIWRQAKENREQMEQERNDKKPAPFKFVKV